MISGFRSDVDEICAFLGCYAGCRFKFLGGFHGCHRLGGWGVGGVNKSKKKVTHWL